MHQIYSNGFLKLKNMDWFVVCAYIYTCIFVYEFYLKYIIGTQYMICKKKNTFVQKKLLEKKLCTKKLWTLNGLKWTIFS
jgi:hypothetical protein